jgi:hypothetical protein
MQAELSSVLATKPAEAGHKPRIPASCNGDRRPVAESSVGCYRARIPAAVETVRQQPKNHAGTAMNLLGGSLLACLLALRLWLAIRCTQRPGRPCAGRGLFPNRSLRWPDLFALERLKTLRANTS